MQNTAAGDVELVALHSRPSAHAQGDVRLQLLHEPITQLATGDVLAVLTGEGRIVDAEDHLQRRLVNRDRRQGDGFSGSARVSPMWISAMPTTARQISPAATSSVSFRPRRSKVQLLHLFVAAPDLTIDASEQGDALALLDLAGEDAADADAADVIAHSRLTTSICKGASLSTSGGGDTLLMMTSNSGAQVLSRDAQVVGSDAITTGGIDRWEIERGVVGVQFDEQVEDAV